MRASRLFAVAVVGLLASCHSNSPSDSTHPPVDPPDPVDPQPEPVAPALPEFPQLTTEAAWIEGDLHVHDDHSSDGSLPRQISDDRLPGNVSIADQIWIAQSRGLDWLPLTDHRTYDQHYDPLWHSDRLLLIAGEEANGSPHATVQGAIDTIVQGRNPEGVPERRRLQQSIWDAHSQGANWVTAHPDDGEMNDDGTPNDRADAVGVDLIEVWNKASDIETEMVYAENRWNAGFRTGIAGASDNHFRELWLVAGPGQPRSGAYAQTRTERGLMAALRAGNMRLRADALAPRVAFSAVTEQGTSLPGDELIAAAGTHVELRIAVENAAGATVRVYQSPGRSAGPMQEFPVGLIGSEVSWSIPLTVGEQPSWYRVEVRGLGGPDAVSFDALADDPLAFVLDQLTSLNNQLLALASPIFVSTAAAEPQLASALPDDGGTDDGAQLVIGADGVFTGFADAASAASMLHVVAEAQDASSSRIVYRRRNADRSWAEPQLISGEGVAARFARVAAQGSQVCIVWQDSSGREIPRHPRILMRRSSDAGASWGAIETLREFEGRAERPTLVLLADGSPLVAWQEMPDGGAFDIAVQTIGRDAEPRYVSREGKSLDTGNPLDTRSPRYPASVWPALAIAPSGDVALAWQDNRHDADPLWTGSSVNGEGSDPDDWQIQLSRLPASSAQWTAAVELGATDRADRHPSLAYSARNRLVVSWDSKTLDSSGANLAIHSTYSDNGVDWSAPVAVFEDVEAMSQYPRLATDSAGDVRAAWYDGRSTDWRWRIATAKLGADGLWNGGRVIASPGINTWPALTSDALVFSSTRAAKRLQRDLTQGIAVLNLGS